MRETAKPVVLVVDDEPKNIKLMRAILVSAGYAGVFCTDGPGALQAVHEFRPDLILLDIMMPGMDGYAVCKCLKDNEATREIPVIFLSAREDTEAQTHGFAVGGADYISKPLQLPVLLARVNTHLSLYQQRRALQGMFHDVMEHAPDAFILGNAQGTIVRVNAQTEKLFQYARKDLVGQPLALLAAPARTPTAPVAGASSPCLPGLPAGIAVPCARSDGSVFPADINVSPMENSGDVLFLSVVRDVSERENTQLELKKSRQSLRELAANREASREEERRHIAREIHDELGQVMTALRMDLSYFQMRFGTLNPDLEAKVSGMKVLVDRAIAAVRNVAGDLRPLELDLGLIAALEWLCTEFASRTTIACLFRTEGAVSLVAEDRAIVLFRIVQESLTNISRHARATHANVGLEFAQATLTLTVQDNGCGFDFAASRLRKSYGLLGMRERAIALDGTLDIDTTEGGGVRIQVTIPLPASSEEMETHDSRADRR